jgi:polyisoprenoid-binding protein YceI
MSSLADLTPGVWNVDASHSVVGFSARHLMISKVRGRFTDFSGTVTIAEDPLQSTVEANVDLSSVTTGDDQRDAHLKSGDFFDIENHPHMTFASNSLKADGEDFIMTGDLTVAGRTRTVDFELEFDGVEKDPWGGTRAGFTASTEISRKDWELTWNVALETGGVLVGDKVKIELDVRAGQGLILLADGPGCLRVARPRAARVRPGRAALYRRGAAAIAPWPRFPSGPTSCPVPGRADAPQHGAAEWARATVGRPCPRSGGVGRAAHDLSERLASPPGGSSPPGGYETRRSVVIHITRHLVMAPAEAAAAFDEWLATGALTATSRGSLRLASPDPPGPSRLRAVPGRLALRLSPVPLPVELELVGWGEWRAALTLHPVRRFGWAVAPHRRTVTPPATPHGPHRPPPPDSGRRRQATPYHDQPYAPRRLRTPVPMPPALYEAATALTRGHEVAPACTPRSWLRPCPRRSSGPTTGPAHHRPDGGPPQTRPLGRRAGLVYPTWWMGHGHPQGLAGRVLVPGVAFHPTRHEPGVSTSAVTGRRRSRPTGSSWPAVRLVHDGGGERCWRCACWRPPLPEARAHCTRSTRRRTAGPVRRPGRQRLSRLWRSVGCSSSRPTRAGQLPRRGAAAAIRPAAGAADVDHLTSTPRASSPSSPVRRGATAGPASGRRPAGPVIRSQATSPHAARLRAADARPR